MCQEAFDKLKSQPGWFISSNENFNMPMTLGNFKTKLSSLSAPQTSLTLNALAGLGERWELPCVSEQESDWDKGGGTWKKLLFFFFFGPGEAAAATDGLTSLTSSSLCKGGFSQPRTYKKQADATKTRYQSQWQSAHASQRNAINCFYFSMLSCLASTKVCVCRRTWV